MYKELMTIFKENETMQFLGLQCPNKIFTAEILQKLDEIAKARPGEVSRDCACDIFMLGYTYGQRHERNKKGTAQPASLNSSLNAEELPGKSFKHHNIKSYSLEREKRVNMKDLKILIPEMNIAATDVSLIEQDNNILIIQNQYGEIIRRRISAADLRRRASSVECFLTPDSSYFMLNTAHPLYEDFKELTETYCMLRAEHIGITITEDIPASLRPFMSLLALFIDMKYLK